ncbi:sialate O-acetylesterase [Parapedobacter composti]|nr:sialate O-acetylesterase [Parapedobacter composti]
MNKTLIVGLQLFFSCFTITTFAQPQKDVHIYILMGQSNMAGRGKITDDYAQHGHPRVMTFNQSGEWEPAKHPLHFDKPKMAGVGPGLTFGMAMAEAYPNAIIGLVPCAVGGTSIAKWIPGAYDDKTNTHPYDDAVARIRQAMKTGIVKGVIWHQGEGDSNEASSKVYLERLTVLIGRIRAVVGNSNLPFIVGQLARYRNNYQLINSELRKLPASVEHTTVVSSEGLWHLGDGTHFDSFSAAEFGRRFAAGMLRMQPHLAAVQENAVFGKADSYSSTDAQGWEVLFDGNDPNIRWRSINGDQFPEKGWAVEDDMLVILPGRKGKDIITREQFSDFELELEVKLTDSANTGVKYIVAPLRNAKGKTVFNGPEYQLIDDFKHESVKGNRSPETSSGSAYLLYAPNDNKTWKHAGEWNHIRIIVKGKHIEHWLNGKKILAYERGTDGFRKRVAETKFKEYQTSATAYGEATFGHILLQDHGDSAYFRNIKIRRLH